MPECNVMVDTSFEMMTLVVLSSWTTAPPSCHPLLGDVWPRHKLSQSICHPLMLWHFHLQCQNFSRFKVGAISLDFGIKSWISLALLWQSVDLFGQFCPTLIISTHSDFQHDKFWWTSKVSIEPILSRPLVSPQTLPLETKPGLDERKEIAAQQEGEDAVKNFSHKTEGDLKEKLEGQPDISLRDTETERVSLHPFKTHQKVLI